MSPHDIIPILWQPGMWARRVLVDALEAAGRPPINSALRLKPEQLDAWNAYLNGTGAPADNPNRPDIYPLAHVRGVAADIDPTPARIAALTAAGLRRPYVYEPWHWEIPNVRAYPLVERLPALAGGNARPITTRTRRRRKMCTPLVIIQRTNSALPKAIVDPLEGTAREITRAENDAYRALEADGKAKYVTVSDEKYAELLAKL